MFQTFNPLLLLRGFEPATAQPEGVMPPSKCSWPFHKLSHDISYVLMCWNCLQTQAMSRLQENQAFTSTSVIGLNINYKM